MAAQNLTLRVPVDGEDARLVIVRFLKDYFSSTGLDRAVLGLSGGLDSAVVAGLLNQALGPPRVRAVIMPASEASAQEVNDARTVAANLGVDAVEISVAPLVEGFNRVLPGAGVAGSANATARARMIVLHEQARRDSALVVGTGNKSEMLTGYFTKFGDGGVDLQPIGDLYKTQVRALAQVLDVPQRILDKAPSAGLWPGQTDEGDLGMSYATLDRVLLGLEVRMELDIIASIVEVPIDDVRRIARLRAGTQHKRRMPLAPKIGLRTPGVDWRSHTVA